jgi:hypothetical protein
MSQSATTISNGEPHSRQQPDKNQFGDDMHFICATGTCLYHQQCQSCTLKQPECNILTASSLLANKGTAHHTCHPNADAVSKN